MITPLVQSLHEATGLNDAQIHRLIIRAPHAYKVYTIPKKSGGTRTIAQPAKEIKFLQRWLMKKVFDRLPIHECATAYRSGASIKINAATHQSNAYISKFDLENFFPSIKETDLIQHFRKHLHANTSDDDILRIARLCCMRTIGSQERQLSVGAPSSPLLSNSLMFDFDSEIASWCVGNGFVYTRYADDLTFSTNTKGNSKALEAEICRVIGNLIYPKIRLNKRKTIHLSKKYQRRITGLIVNNDGKLSIGRDRKREISTLIHRHSLKLLSPEEGYQLQGLLGFAKDIEPNFMTSVRRKYGAVIIDAIFQIRKTK